ncbi:MAG: alpha/beta hydrolase-fold protein [Bacteroidales bacterium]
MKKIVTINILLVFLVSGSCFQKTDNKKLQQGKDIKLESGDDLATQWIAKQKANLDMATFELYPQPSRGEGKQGSFLLYLPKDYKTGNKRYPVLYTLHGGNGNQSDGEWLIKIIDSAINSGNLEPIIVVSVQALPIGWYCNANIGAKGVVSGSVEDVIIKDLIPYIDKNFRTISSGNGRGIEGWSMGGFGALRLAYKFPGMFNYVSSLAGALIDFEDEPNPQYLENTFGPTTGVEKNQSKAYFDAVHPKRYAKENAKSIITNHIKTRIIVGDGDWLYNKNGKNITKNFSEYLSNLGIENKYSVIRGVGHMLPDAYGSGQIKYPIDFWRDAFKK